MAFRYLVTPDAGLFGYKVIKSVLHLWVSRDKQQQLPDTQSYSGKEQEDSYYKSN